MEHSRTRETRTQRIVFERKNRMCGSERLDLRGSMRQRVESKRQQTSSEKHFLPSAEFNSSWSAAGVCCRWQSTGIEMGSDG